MAARPLVLCGPSGAGKSSIMKLLTAEFPDSFGFSVSHTTRKPRTGEEEAVHYHYISRGEMTEAIAKGDFIESAEFSGNLYGTSKAAVETVLCKGKICILDIEMQGVKQVKVIPSISPVYVFVRPPSMESLEERLRLRQTETEDSLRRRMEAAAEEMKFGEEEGNFDLIVINDDLEEAYKKLREFILPEIERQRSINTS